TRIDDDGEGEVLVVASGRTTFAHHFVSALRGGFTLDDAYRRADEHALAAGGARRKGVAGSAPVELPDNGTLLGAGGAGRGGRSREGRHELDRCHAGRARRAAPAERPDGRDHRRLEASGELSRVVDRAARRLPSRRRARRGDRVARGGGRRGVRDGSTGSRR